MAIWHLAGLAIAAAATGAWAGWTLREWKAGADELARVQQAGHDARRAAERGDDAASSHETERVRIQVVRQVVTRETDRAIAAAPDFYAGDCFDADGLRGIAAALGASAPDPGQPAPAVPGSGAAR